jgi:hypothetical protein
MNYSPIVFQRNSGEVFVLSISPSEAQDGQPLATHPKSIPITGTIRARALSVVLVLLAGRVGLEPTIDSI